MSEALTVVKFGASILKFLNAMLDPDKRRALDEAIVEHVLNELPRMMKLLQERIDDVAASGCTPQEANIMIHQTIESQKRTLEEEKRKRLSNVLVNGFCVNEWDKARHRLMLRLASELEEEHIAILQNTAAFAHRRHTPGATRRALERELISRGLLEEETKQVRNPKWKEPPPPMMDSRGHLVSRPARAERVPEFIDEIHVRRSDLGRQFLEHLRDPAAQHDAQDE